MQNKKTIPQHKENGTYRPGKHGREEDQLSVPPIEKIPPAPSFLGKYGKKEWRRMLKNLTENNLVSGIDLGLLELACVEFNTYRECQEYLVEENDGERNLSIAKYLAGKNSQTAMISGEMKKSFKNYQDVMRIFGVSPIERSKIPSVKTNEEKDEFGEFEEETDL